MCIIRILRGTITVREVTVEDCDLVASLVNQNFMLVRGFSPQYRASRGIKFLVILRKVSPDDALTHAWLKAWILQLLRKKKVKVP